MPKNSQQCYQYPYCSLLLHVLCFDQYLRINQTYVRCLSYLLWQGLLHVWKIKDREGIDGLGFQSVCYPSLEGVHRCPVLCVQLVFELHLDTTSLDTSVFYPSLDLAKLFIFDFLIYHTEKNVQIYTYTALYLLLSEDKNCLGNISFLSHDCLISIHNLCYVCNLDLLSY